MNRDVYSVWSILVFPVFYWNQWMTAVRTFKRIRSGKTFFFWRKGSGTYFTEELPFGIIVFIKVWFRGITAWAGTAVVNITFVPALNRFDLFAIPPFQIREVFFVIPFLVINDIWVNGIIESPLLKRNISTDKIQKPADLFMLVLN